MEPRRYRNFTLRVSSVTRRPGRYHVRIFGLIPGGQPAADERETMTYDPAAFVSGSLNLLDAVQFGQMTRGSSTPWARPWPTCCWLARSANAGGTA